MTTFAGDTVLVTEVSDGFIHGYAAGDPEPKTWDAVTGESFTSDNAKDWLVL